MYFHLLKLIQHWKQSPEPVQRTASPAPASAGRDKDADHMPEYMRSGVESTDDEEDIQPKKRGAFVGHSTSGNNGVQNDGSHVD